MITFFRSIVFFIVSFLWGTQGYCATIESSCINDTTPLYDIDPYTGENIYIGEEIISTYCTTTTRYQLQGVATASSDTTGVISALYPNGTPVVGTLVLSTWTFDDYINGAIDYGDSSSLQLNFDYFFSTGDSYSMEQGVTYSDSTPPDEFGNPIGTTHFWENSTLLFDQNLFPTLWNIEVNGNAATVFTLDGDGDGVSGAAFTHPLDPNQALIVDFQLTAVPVPASAWLLISGIVSLLHFSKRK